MANTTRVRLCLSFAAGAALLGACTALPIFSGFGKIDGCMYYDGRPVPVQCINEAVGVGAKAGGYPFADLKACIAKHRADASGTKAEFVTEVGTAARLSACAFEGSGQRAYYRYDAAGARLYRRFVSCVDGCKIRSDVHKIAFEDGAVQTKLLERSRE